MKLQKNVRLFIICILLMATVGCDQVSKVIARDHLNPCIQLSYLKGCFQLLLTYNNGGFLSLGSQFSPMVRVSIFVVLTAASICITLAYCILVKRISVSRLIALSLIAGGGIGNLIDRILFSGKVTDFMLLSAGPLRTGIFNIADVFIMVGLGLLILEMLQRPNQSINNASCAGSDPAASGRSGYFGR